VYTGHKRAVGHWNANGIAYCMHLHSRAVSQAMRLSVAYHSICTEPNTDRDKLKKLTLRRKLEGCIDDERQFKTTKRPQAPGDATVRKRFFRDNFVIFRHRSKRIYSIFGVSEFFYVCMSTCKFSSLVMDSWPLFGTLQGPISDKCQIIDSPD